jgi:hypothetical protein
MRTKMTAVAGVLALSLSLSAMVGQASAHGSGRGGHRGFFGKNAIVTGTVTSVGDGTFGANAYVLAPGAGGGNASATTTPVTIAEGTNTKVVTFGQSGITVGDTFFATYKGESSTTPISTLVAGTPSKIFAFVAPTPQVEVSGVITAISATGDQFTATASVAQPRFGGSPWNPPHGPIMGTNHGGGPSSPGGVSGTGYSYGGKVGGSYGFSGSRRGKVAHNGRSHGGSVPTTVTPDTTITTDSATTFDVNGNNSLTFSSLAVGDTFTATFDGTPSESLADIVANPALSVTAYVPNALYAFVGTVTGTDTTSSPETVSVNVTGSTPAGLFTGTDTFDIGPGTFVLGGAGGSLLGSLGNVTTGDVVAGGLVTTGGQAASAIEADPLQALVDFSASSPSSSSAASLRRIRRADLKKAMELLRKDRVKGGGRKHKKH